MWLVERLRDRREKKARKALAQEIALNIAEAIDKERERVFLYGSHYNGKGQG